MDLEKIQIHIDKPYPDIVGAKEDQQTVNILKNLISSRIGELTGVLQYQYQAVVADKIDEEISKIFEEIGVVEMEHIELLMHGITDFGGVPKYEDMMRNSFCATTINYTFKLKEMLENNIVLEQKAIDSYIQASEAVKNKSLKDLLLRIKEDEEKHLQTFKYILSNVKFMSI